MVRRFCNWLMTIWSDERGEDNLTPSLDKGQTGDDLPSGTDQKGEIPPAKDDIPAENKPPKYSEFGDAPTVDQVYEHYAALKGKNAATEKNIASLRKALQDAGVKSVIDERGVVTLIADSGDDAEETPKQWQKRFTDEHKALFAWEGGDKVLNAIELKIQDVIEDIIEERDRTTKMHQTVAQKWMSEYEYHCQKMFEDFPQLDSKNKEFNREFYDKALSIREEKYMKRDRKSGKLIPTSPQADRLAALEAARELKIAPAFAKAFSDVDIERIKKEAYEAGKSGKTVLGAAGGGQKPANDKGKKTKEEYLAMTPDEREAYDKKQLNV